MRAVRICRPPSRPARQPRASSRAQALAASLFAVYAAGPDGRVRWPELVGAHPDVVTLRLPHRLESPNAWLWAHWRVKARAKAAWAARLELAVDRADRSRLPRPRSAFPTIASRVGWVVSTTAQRPAVIVTRQVPSRRNFITDRENRYFSAKALVDCLVDAGFLVNDRERDIDLAVEQAVSGDGLDWTVITIDARPLELRIPGGL